MIYGTESNHRSRPDPPTGPRAAVLPELARKTAPKAAAAPSSITATLGGTAPLAAVPEDTARRRMAALGSGPLNLSDGAAEPVGDEWVALPRRCSIAGREVDVEAVSCVQEQL